MKRARLLALALVVFGGVVAWGQWWCDPCGPPPPPPLEPSCYVTFWAGEPIQVDLVVPWGILCCNPCGPATMIIGWSVEAFGGGVVYQYAYPVPVGGSTKIIWNQQDSTGVQMSPGFYRIAVMTTTGVVTTHVKIVVQTDCCWSWCQPVSKPCGVSWCDPYLKLSRAPVCDPCGWSSCDPCCWPLFPFLFFLGIGK